MISLDLGFKEFKECIFLDWDCKQIKSIDNLEFNSPSMLLYSYPKEYKFSNPNITKQVKTFGWELDDFYVLPNACCITVKGFNLGKELLSIHEKYNFDTLVEEFVLRYLQIVLLMNTLKCMIHHIFMVESHHNIFG